MSVIQRIYVMLVTAVIMTSVSLPAQAQSVKLQRIPADRVDVLIQTQLENHEPTIVFLYASWCAVCRDNFPKLLELARNYKSKHLNVIALSMDKNPVALEQYLASHGDVPFKGYYITEKFSGETVKSLNRIGVKFANSIPYTVLYNRSGTIVAQGNYRIKSLAPFIENLSYLKKANTSTWSFSQ